jgi:predicted HTH domain antitoxin
MGKSEAWDYALGIIKADGLKPSDEFLQLVEKEKKGEISEQELKDFLDQKYKIKNQENLTGFDNTKNYKAISILLPEDILSEIESFDVQGQTLEEKLKLNLAIGLFVSKAISLGKASELAGKSLAEFISILNSTKIPVVDYNDEVIEDDLNFIKNIVTNY